MVGIIIDQRVEIYIVGVNSPVVHHGVVSDIFRASSRVVDHGVLIIIIGIESPEFIHRVVAIIFRIKSPVVDHGVVISIIGVESPVFVHGVESPVVLRGEMLLPSTVVDQRVKAVNIPTRSKGKARGTTTGHSPGVSS